MDRMRTRRIPSFTLVQRCKARDGREVDGRNVENAAYPAGICAPSGASCGGGGARRQSKFVALAIVTKAEAPTPPCGMCRQVLEEFAPESVAVLSVTSAAEAQWTIADLPSRGLHPHIAGPPVSASAR